MPAPTTPEPAAPTELGDGLVLRPAGPDDVDAVVELTARTFGDHDAAPARAHLTGGAGTEWVVVAVGPGAAEPGGGRLLSASARIPHRFHLDGHPVQGSQIEYVVTDPSVRDRGLVRAQFALHHRRAAAAGELAQFVGGIPYLYRKVGYGYALDHARLFLLDEAAVRAAAAADLAVRPATADDLPWLVASDADRPVEGLRVRRGVETWRTWLAATSTTSAPPTGTDAPGTSALCRTDAPTAGTGALPPSGAFARPGGTFDVLDVAERGGRPVGWLRAHADNRSGDLHVLPSRADDPGAALALLAHAHDLARQAGRYAPARHGDAFTVIAYDSPGTAWGDALHRHGAGFDLPTGVYGRVADPLALLRHLAPLLSARLGASRGAASDGDVRISFYGSAVDLRWSDGVVVAVEPAPADPDPFGHGGVGVAPDWFPALAFGRWGAAGLAERADDVMLGVHAEVMEILFPARPSELAADF